MEINKVQILIRTFLHETKDVVLDAGAAQKWLSKFRDTLIYQELEKEPLPYALHLLEEANAFNKTQKLKMMIRWAKHELSQEGIQNPTKEQIHAKCIEKYNGEYKELIQNNNNSAPQNKPVVNVPGARKQSMPTDKQIVIEWAIDNKIDEIDAYNCWNRTMELGGCDPDGKPINNWKSYVRKWAINAKNKREKENK